MARTARREVISLLIEKQMTYTEAEANVLIAQAKNMAEVSGRTVRAEAELLLSSNRETRLRGLRNKAAEARERLAAIAVEADDLRAESGDDDGELVAIMAEMAAACDPFSSASASGASTTTAKPGRPPAPSVTGVVPGPTDSLESPQS